MSFPFPQASGDILICEDGLSQLLVLGLILSPAEGVPLSLSLDTRVSIAMFGLANLVAIMTRESCKLDRNTLKEARFPTLCGSLAIAPSLLGKAENLY